MQRTIFQIIKVVFHSWIIKNQIILLYEKKTNNATLRKFQMVCDKCTQMQQLYYPFPKWFWHYENGNSNNYQTSTNAIQVMNIHLDLVFFIRNYFLYFDHNPVSANKWYKGTCVDYKMNCMKTVKLLTVKSAVIIMTSTFKNWRNMQSVS